MAAYLKNQGYETFNIDYPSRKSPISVAVEKYLKPVMVKIRDQYHRIDFVTHSMGGILLRHYIEKNKRPLTGRAVMLAPPNQGSEVADFLSRYKIIRRIMGPALGELRTCPQSFVNRLADPDFNLGVITGNRSVNPINSWIIPGPDDGKVSVKRAGVKNMIDFQVVPCTHAFIMKNPEVMKKTLLFLKSGSFSPGADD